MNKNINLSLFDNSWYKPGKNKIVRLLWYFANAAFFLNPFFTSVKFKIFILKLFGAKTGKNVVIKPSVNIKYPWKLLIGNNVWIGENVWIDNLEDVKIGNNVCISQGAMLLCGNHNYSKESFDLITEKIIIEDGVWIGAKSIVVPGTVCKSHSVLTVGSVSPKMLEPFYVYKGNPAVAVKTRKIDS